MSFWNPPSRTLNFDKGDLWEGKKSLGWDGVQFLAGKFNKEGAI